MVRVTVPLGNSEAIALEAATDMAARGAAALSDFVPE
jgi:hypothetical protein